MTKFNQQKFQSASFFGYQVLWNRFSNTNFSAKKYYYIARYNKNIIKPQIISLELKYQTQQLYIIYTCI